MNLFLCQNNYKLFTVDLTLTLYWLWRLWTKWTRYEEMHVSNCLKDVMWNEGSFVQLAMTSAGEPWQSKWTNHTKRTLLQMNCFIGWTLVSADIHPFTSFSPCLWNRWHSQMGRDDVYLLCLMNFALGSRAVQHCPPRGPQPSFSLPLRVVFDCSVLHFARFSSDMIASLRALRSLLSGGWHSRHGA